MMMTEKLRIASRPFIITQPQRRWGGGDRLIDVDVTFLGYG
jgi:hypothetical protein